MFKDQDYNELNKKGISVETVVEQLARFTKGFPALTIVSPVTPQNGLRQVSNKDMEVYLQKWYNYLEFNKLILKFVPASGAASRMFKDLFEYLETENEDSENESVKQFFSQINRFAFYETLNSLCFDKTGNDISSLIRSGKKRTIVEHLLTEKGLNYGLLPKGLLMFHKYNENVRTAFQEHLAEGALYAMNKQKQVNIHFTVSTEHRELFEKHLTESVTVFESQFDATFHISFSEQKPSTDTIAADSNNNPFRENGKLVFRPGGHGALIENLNDLDADIIFIKNIDNVVPDALKNPTIVYKKVLAGMLVDVQQKCFKYLQKLDQQDISAELLSEIAIFSEKVLNNHQSNVESMTDSELKAYLYGKLNRPIRVCGMVKNTGEPGGGPFLTVNQDGSVSPQILESSQIDLKNPTEKAKMMSSTHFNPVDLVCGIKNYRGEKFDLTHYVDKSTGFISSKSKNGKELKALELPGLWNGAMSDWNSIFVEVPVITFNPVKTVNDLLRTEHQ